MAAGAASSEVSAEASNPLTTRCKPPLPTDTSASTASTVNWVLFTCVLTRCTVGAGRYRGPGHCLASLYRAGGLPGCYRGLPAQVLPAAVSCYPPLPAQAARDIIASGLYFLIYSQAAGPEAGPTQVCRFIEN